MIANKLVALTATAALFEQALALGSHRHIHQLQKRVVHTDWVTVWQTVYATAGQEAPAPAATPVNNNYQAPVEDPAVVVPASPKDELEAEAPAPVPEAPAPVPAQSTTLSQVARPSKAPKAPKVADEEVAAAEPTKATPKEQPAKKKAGAASKKTKPSGSSNSGGGSVGFSHKRGIAYNDVDMAATFGSSCTNCGWAYNWDSESYDLDSKYDFIPTLWDATPDHTSRFAKNVEKCLSNGSKAIFSFNEPDMGGQANLDPATAAAKHAEYLNDYAGKALISAPSVSNSGQAGEGLQWLESFVTASEAQEKKCHYDFCSVHWYSEVQYGETLFDHLDKAHKVCGGKPIWLTEFAPKGSDEAISAWLEEAIPRLEALDYLHAYAYFMVGEGNLMSSKTELNAIGQKYASI
ncbi:hypothetical protein FZEAL_10218 [Fusarium zealandicum]|uniref:Asl1-like glycosyl hydrolase catalytic domain-containing protein n=1 Tax=Fusarium zealandicum TaxID=1053134 RepID=A0A8H4XC24_9HYPO|nr:hypothetical protein FZEAL_10218 [Fusarium zealandicum]